MPAKKSPEKKSSVKHIIIYTTTSCPYCRMAKDYFARKKIKYKEIDVASDKKAAQEMIKKSGQMGVPVIDINGKIIVGYDRHEIEQALRMD